MVKSREVGLVAVGVVLGVGLSIAVLTIELRRAFGLPALPLREDENG